MVERLVASSLPASLELSLAAIKDIESERKELHDHWQQRLARSRYEVEQARRQYAAVDPEHRLVARELERRWDEALRADEQLLADYARFQQDCPTQLSSQSAERILALSQDLPALWHADTTTAEDRQAVARLLLEQVTVTVEGNSDRVDVELRWAGGFVSRHTLSRPVQTYEQLSNYERTGFPHRAITRRTQDVVGDRRDVERGRLPPAKAIAPLHPGNMLSCFLRESWRSHRPLPRSVTEGTASAQASGGWRSWRQSSSMPIATLHRWQRVGWLTSRKVAAAGGRWAIYADADEITPPPSPSRGPARLAKALPDGTDYPETESRRNPSRTC